MRKRITAYVFAAIAIVVAYPYVILKLSERDFTAQVTERLASGAEIGGSEISGWAQALRMQALTLAEVTATTVEDKPRLSQLLDSLQTAGAFSSAWVIAPTGELIGKTASAANHEVVSTGPHIIRTTAGFFIDFAERAGRAGAPLVIIRSPFTAESFRRLNPTAFARTRTTRSTVLWQQGDSVYVVLSESRETNADIPRAYARTSLPQIVRDAIGGRRGEGRGIGADQVYYASTRVKLLDLPLVRQVSSGEALAATRIGLFLQGALIAGLLLALALLAESRWKAAQIGREQQVARLRDDFVSSVSHELRTPLAQIRMYAELLRQGSMSGKEDTARALYVIEKEARRLNILVDNILSFAHLRRRSDELVTRPTSIFDDVHYVLEAFGPLASERGVSVTADVPEEISAHVDSLALRQILLNLLENAAKYGPRNQSISIVATADGDDVKLTVDDEGSGIPLNERDKVWTPFFRGTASAASDIPGSGIGLSVVRDLVTRHDGTATIEESPAGGARFVLTFKRAD